MNLRNVARQHRFASLALLGLAIPAASLSQQKTGPSSSVPAPVEEIVIVSAPRPPLQPGELVDLGLTYDLGVFRAPPAPASGAPSKLVLRPGEGPGGTALLNPNRAYRPGWDSTLIPGYSMPYSNSRNDYVEGRTMAYPPGEGVQTTTGGAPMMPAVGGDVPKVVSTPNGGSPPLMGPSMNPPMISGGSETPIVPDVHDVPRVGYDPNLPPPSAPPKR